MYIMYARRMANKPAKTAVSESCLCNPCTELCFEQAFSENPQAEDANSAGQLGSAAFHMLQNTYLSACGPGKAPCRPREGFQRFQSGRIICPDLVTRLNSPKKTSALRLPEGQLMHLIWLIWEPPLFHGKAQRPPVHGPPPRNRAPPQKIDKIEG